MGEVGRKAGSGGGEGQYQVKRSRAHLISGKKIKIRG